VVERVVAARPRLNALRRFGGGIASGARADRMGEPVPQLDVRALLRGVPAPAPAAALGGHLRSVGDSDDRVPVLPGIDRELLAAQLALRPAHVERMLEDVVVGADLVEAGP